MKETVEEKAQGTDRKGTFIHVRMCLYVRLCVFKWVDLCLNTVSIEVM